MGPKEGLEFADYTFDEHFGRPIASYPPRAVLFDYIKGRVEKAGVRDWIKFRHACRRVDYDPAKETFRVVVQDLVNDREVVDEYRPRGLRDRPFLDAERALLIRASRPITGASCTPMTSAMRSSSRTRTS